MRILQFLLLLLTMNFYGCNNSKTEEKDKQEQQEQEFQQRPDYSKDTLSA